MIKADLITDFTPDMVEDYRFVLEKEGFYIRVDADIVYQWMAERFRRENETENVRALGFSLDLVEKSDDA